MKQCGYCGKETANPRFCSKSCSARITNAESPKRKKSKRFCEVCGKDITYLGKSQRRRFCDEHNDRIVDWSKVALADVRARRKYQANSRIRELARALYRKSDRPKKCEVCGYDKHYDVAHIKGISEFSPDTVISVINDLNNLKALCKNCHWEFDNGILNIDMGSQNEKK